MEWFPTLLANDEKFKDPTDMANAFNNLFTTNTEKINIQQIEKGDAILILKDSFPGKFPILKIIPITDDGIKSIIHYLTPEKS